MSDSQPAEARSYSPQEIPEAITECVIAIDADATLTPEERHDNIMGFLRSVIHEMVFVADKHNHETPREEPRPFSINYNSGEHASFMEVLIAESYRRIGEARAQQEFERIRHLDPLTGLANRDFWNDELNKVIATVRYAGDERRVRNSYAVLFIDLNGFGKVNKKHGQLAGDEILQNTAVALIDSLRAEDVVARLGGDEFAVLLNMPFASKGKIPSDKDLERVRAKIETALATEYEVEDGRCIGTSASVGAAFIRIGDTPSQVMNRADRDMAKRKEAAKSEIQSD